jgi:hypothetical protein
MVTDGPANEVPALPGLSAQNVNESLPVRIRAYRNVVINVSVTALAAPSIEAMLNAPESQYYLQ